MCFDDSPSSDPIGVRIGYPIPSSGSPFSESCNKPSLGDFYILWFNPHIISFASDPWSKLPCCAKQPHFRRNPLKCTTIPSEISIYEAFRCRPLLQMKQSVDQRTAGAVKRWLRWGPRANCLEMVLPLNPQCATTGLRMARTKLGCLVLLMLLHSHHG
jgi:hypothetical protein